MEGTAIRKGMITNRPGHGTARALPFAAVVSEWVLALHREELVHRRAHRVSKEISAAGAPGSS